MRRVLLVCVFLASTILDAQDIRIIGGELAPAIVVDGNVKIKKLVGSGSRIAGGIGIISAESIGKEIGSVITVKRDFKINSIDFTILKNSLENCKGDLRIYSISPEDNLDCILQMPIIQSIPISEEKSRYNIIPQEEIQLQPGRYYISFSINEIDTNINGKDTTGKEIVFPLYMKKSFVRKSNSSKLEKIGFNIGITLKGI